MGLFLKSEKKRKFDMFFFRDFSFVEPLVVMVIIFFALFIVGYLNKTREMAKDTIIMANLNQVRFVAQIFYLDKEKYDDLCKEGTLNTIGALVFLKNDIEENQIFTDIKCHADASYCIAAKLNKGGSFCISSDGIARAVASSTKEACLTSTTSCNSNKQNI